MPSSPPCPSVPASLCPSLLSDLTSPHHSLASVAAKHNIALDDLLIWLQHPATRERMALHESAAYSHVRYVGALNLSHAVHTTIKTLETFNAIPRPADPLDPEYTRASIHARKAAWLLYRFSRLTPIDDAQLARARATLHATRAVEAQTKRVPLDPCSDAQRHESEPAANSAPTPPLCPCAPSSLCPFLSCSGAFRILHVANLFLSP